MLLAAFAQQQQQTQQYGSGGSATYATLQTTFAALAGGAHRSRGKSGDEAGEERHPADMESAHVRLSKRQQLYLQGLVLGIYWQIELLVLPGRGGLDGLLHFAKFGCDRWATSRQVSRGQAGLSAMDGHSAVALVYIALPQNWCVLVRSPFAMATCLALGAPHEVDYRYARLRAHRQREMFCFDKWLHFMPEGQAFDMCSGHSKSADTHVRTRKRLYTALCNFC